MNSKNSDKDEIDDSDRPSKTAVKKEMLALTDLGKELCELPFDKVKRGPLSERLLEEISIFHKCRTFGAKKRQTQFIGKLMRNEDAEEIRAWIDGETVEQKMQVLHMHAAEQWRDELLARPEALAEFIDAYPDAAKLGLNQVIRAANQEKASNKPPKLYRQLYKQVYSLISQASSEEEM